MTIAPLSQRHWPAGTARLGEIAWPGVDPYEGGRLLKEEAGVLVWDEPGEGADGTVLKLYRNIDPASELRYRLFTYRVEREWLALRLLSERGVACTEPVHWFRGRSRAWRYCQGLRTRRIAGCGTLKEGILDGRIDPTSIELEPLYHLVSGMHEAGVFHGALWPSNVLERSVEGKTELYLCDLARSVIFGYDLRRSRAAAADLLDLSLTLEEIGVVVKSADLEAYGFEPKRRKSFLRRLRAYRSNGVRHQAVRGEILLRQALAGRRQPD